MDTINRFVRELPFDDAVDLLNRSERANSETLDLILLKSMTANMGRSARNERIIALWQQIVVQDGVEPSDWAHRFFVKCCFIDSQSEPSMTFLKDLFYEQVVRVNQYAANNSSSIQDEVSLLDYLGNVKYNVFNPR